MHRLRQETGTDLSKYKRPTLLRRIGRRMQVRDIEHLGDYADLVASDAEELHELFDELLIGVTEFFRNREDWETLDDRVIPEIFEAKDSDDEVRVWVPGCSTGEEAYTVAMLLCRHADQLRASPTIKVFATDIDEKAIDVARQATYPPAIASDIPSDLMSRYFQGVDDQFQVTKSVRRRVMFAIQNVLTDPPFPQLDLVSCRNLLIYL
ncbi:MAG: protein-glutamate O-methyltransferase CheR, partial [Bradymonadaceae bacterium]